MTACSRGPLRRWLLYDQPPAVLKYAGVQGIARPVRSFGVGVRGAFLYPNRCFFVPPDPAIAAGAWRSTV